MIQHAAMAHMEIGPGAAAATQPLIDALMSPGWGKSDDVVKQEVAERAFPILAERTTIDYASLGSDAGFIGAAGLARRDHMKL